MRIKFNPYNHGKHSLLELSQYIVFHTNVLLSSLHMGCLPRPSCPDNNGRRHIGGIRTSTFLTYKITS